MIDIQMIAVLFDFDGVVMDTESQYSVFWHKVGVDYLDMEDLETRVKGQTLKFIYDTFFPGKVNEQLAITEALERYEQQMDYSYVPGVKMFIEDLRYHDVKLAVVTSSNNEKMEAVYRRHPEIKKMFDRILTAEMFSHSKPAPDCFLLGMDVFGTTPQTTYVFEDSFNGLKAGMASGATVIGLATTNPRNLIEGKAHFIINDFKGMTYDKLMKNYTFVHRTK
ncbi:MAG: HAD family hydrolase [Bacteroides sp.]|jgi:HAD superfamily hydrolase (TIGR01509 family)|nr:HAD family hydrolase [Bacteroides sp.]MCI1682956.1 HAD family hydrolase [Bacteroides sp.]